MLLELSVAVQLQHKGLFKHRKESAKTVMLLIVFNVKLMMLVFVLNVLEH
jgi:hypothetical protein